MAAKKRKKNELKRKKKAVIARKRQAKPTPKAKKTRHKPSARKTVSRKRKATPRKRKAPIRGAKKKSVRRAKRTHRRPKRVGDTARKLKAEVRKLKARLDIAEKTEGFVHAHDIEYLRRNGTIAKNPSIHRHRFNESQFKKLRKELKQAIGAHDHNRLARISAIFEIPLRELYTLFFSP